MSFWEIGHYGSRIALIDTDTDAKLTYNDLQQQAAAFAHITHTSDAKRLGLILASNTADCLVTYIAALQQGDAVMLFDEKLESHLVERIVTRYQPDWIVARDPSAIPKNYAVAGQCGGLLAALASQPCKLPLHADLAVLLSTSGSTGSPKLVRLSRKNVQANAASIAEYLSLTPDSLPITTLPMAYSYGLSVINSHLQCGATLLLSRHSVTQRPFWDAFEKHHATSIAGVPYMYQLMLRLGLLNRPLASLKTLTQAGGKLDAPLVEQVRQIAEKNGWKFFVMYGQTEATARISFVPPDRLKEKPDTVGIPIPGGQMRVDEDTQELVYRGPNVMMGYAEDRPALAQGDELCGELRTGDLARQDDDGFFYITGRLRRFIKIYGNRFNLDEVESILRQNFDVPLACFGRDDELCVAIGGDRVAPSAIVTFLLSMFQLNANAVRTLVVERIPYNSNGKIDYPTLSSAAALR